ncbi:MAG: ribonuclease P protein component [Chloroflexi bacterium]|nr:ribonuclease P protein component [Chloroflexota bacterium]
MLTLKTSQDFQRVRREGRSWGHPLIVLIACPNDQSNIRVGIAAGKNVGNAVARNRAKRRLRSALRQAEAQLAPGWDVVLIARPPLVKARWPDVTEALAQLMRRAKLLRGSEG